MAAGWIQRFIVFASALLLAACAGTIQRESSAGAHRLEAANYSKVDIVLGEEARRAQADNPLFNARELGDYIRRQLESRELLDPQSPYRVEVTIDSMRVRSGLSAVMLGVMAGSDSIQGYVRVYDARGRQVHGYKVNASYALGGIAGGQDSTRLGWLYSKFSELTVAELAGATPADAVAKGRAQPAPRSTTMSITPAGTASPAPAAPAAVAPMAAIEPAPQVAAIAPPRIASGFAAIDDIDAIPYLNDRGRKGYADWLNRGTPRAFAISSKGNWFATSGLTPQDASLPTDPAERALLLCQRAAQVPCKLYAVNRAVVWTREAP